MRSRPGEQDLGLYCECGEKSLEDFVREVDKLSFTYLNACCVVTGCLWKRAGEV